MIWFLLAAGLLSVVVVAMLLGPLLRSQPGRDDDEPVAVMFRRHLAGIDEELAEGRLTPAEAETARTDISRRLLAAVDREPASASAPARSRSEMWRFGAAIGIAGLLPAAAMAVYYAVGTPAASERPAAAEKADPHDAAELAAAADRIKAHLQQAPDDLKGWTLLGRTLASLGRFPEARDAYAHAIALSPGNAALHAEFGEVLVLEAQGTVTADAAAEFAKAPADARSRYYTAEEALQHGDPTAAAEKLRALLASAPADAPWRQTVADRLAELSRAAGAAPGAAAPGAAPTETVPGSTAAAAGPTAQEVAAAQSMSPEERQTMIRGMVERLAQRLDQSPDDKAGWERLARAYDVLGEPAKAQAARARAAAAGTVAAAPVSPPVGSGAAAGNGPTPAPSSTAAPSAAIEPRDAQGWIERARGLAGQGRTADALAALKQGNTAFPGNLPLLKAYLSALADGLKDDQPTPEFVAVANQINALDAKQPDALWYLGLTAAKNGDRYRAASYWSRLVADLPTGDPRRALVQHRLDALR